MITIIVVCWCELNYHQGSHTATVGMWTWQLTLSLLLISRSSMALLISAVPQPVQNDVAPLQWANHDAWVWVWVIGVILEFNLNFRNSNANKHDQNLSYRVKIHSAGFPAIHQLRYPTRTWWHSKPFAVVTSHGPENQRAGYYLLNDQWW